ncbi:MAG: DMT family transporter [Thiotrichales bacterium]|jgi:drug/metabolite transporter (DMT)-like permease|nr:DMT family transporter [Thiotrichales bacterium]MBT4652976.1 DMT family transporter [Thiotrichales bacterium]MBT5500542.1 DMT family transporter [Thiotrichales bacterium]MBT7150033.1 DMT family transporter [Thiotrichales bacterium]MBT7438701.1 DMT family transporter [Thiotrichales bacterium]
MSNHLKGLLIAFFGVLILTPEGILVKLANSDSFTILFWRGLFLTLSILIILLISYRSNALNQIKGIGKEGLLIGCLTGFGGTTFILAIHYTTLAKTLVIISASPLMVALVSFILLGERPRLFTWLAMLIVFSGIYIVMSGDTSGLNLKGSLFALASVTSGGFSFTLLRKYKEVNMVPAMAINGLFITFVGLFFADSLSLSSQAMTYIVISSVLVAISFSLITIAPRYIPAPEVAIFFPMGTVIGTVLAWLILKEELSNNAVFGGVVVILTLFIHSIYSARQSNN